ncbi:MAG: glycosyltransferase [Thermoplasmatales archaeon]|nr:glycosyltransferase [Thermoplasmatales archaeon]
MNKKIAIFHDYFTAIGGGEKLMLTLAKGIKADVISTDIDKERIRKAGFDDVNVIEIGKNPPIPGLKQVYTTSKFLTCDFSDKYDFFIFSGNWAHYASFHHHPNLYYCHTPVRAFYDLRENIIKDQKGLKKIFFRIWTWGHAKLDKLSMKYMDKIVVNSKNVQERVRKFYCKNSEIVHPSIPTSNYYFGRIGDFWLSVNRLYPHKRIELQLEIFRKLPDEKLKIVGWYGKGDEAEKYVNKLRIPKNVELLGEIDEKELTKLYAECKGHITTAQDEDFGMTPLEAMASGKITLAANEGGYRETIMDGKTGWLLPANVDAFVNKIKKIGINELEKMKDECINRAKKFDEKKFMEKMSSLIEC